MAMLKKNLKYLILLTALLASCATLVTNYEELYGPSTPRTGSSPPTRSPRPALSPSTNRYSQF